MGRYMNRKAAKITDDVAVMEVPQSTLLGVRTRAKTLALQRLHSSSNPSPVSDSDSSCYLQLRSRRLEKLSLLKPQTQKSGEQVEEVNRNPRSGSSLRNVSVSSGSVKSGSIRRPKVGNRVADETEQGFDSGIDASFGENNSDFQASESRSTRESTPCSFIREADVSTPPGSSTRQRSLDATNWRSRNAILRNIPTPYEMDEFFARAEQEQQQKFIEKYNFDIVADVPLPGRYEWVRVNH